MQQQNKVHEQDSIFFNYSVIGLEFLENTWADSHDSPLIWVKEKW